MTDIEILREASPIEDIAGQYTQLHKDGNRLSGLCPLHSETHPSFKVYPETQTCYCFGCNRGGDVLDLVMLKEGIGFWEALRWLARRANMPLPTEDAELKAKLEERRAIEDVLTLAAQHYHQQLMNKLGAEFQREYLRQRGFTEDTVRELKIGYASGMGLMDFLHRQSISDELVLKAGLIQKNEQDGSFYEFFRQRIVFPNLDAGRATYFTGRATREGGEPKYLHLPGEKPLYISTLRRGHKEIILVEGPTDAIAFWQWGYSVIGLMGSSLKKQFLPLLERFDLVHICLDGDEAGLRGVVEISDLIGAKVRIITLPEGLDPNNYFLGHTTGDFEELMKNALDYIRYQVMQIPPDIDKLRLPTLLEPILKQLMRLTPAQADAYLNYTIKPHFGLKAEEVKSLKSTLGQMRREKRQKEGEEQAKQAPVEQISPMTEEERKKALIFLENPDLIDLIRQDITKIGIVGEKRIKLFLYLAYTSRKSSKPISLEARAPSGVGKTFIVLTLTQLMPPEDVVVMSRITTRYLDYLKEDAVKGKVFIIGERAGGEDADYSIRMMADDTSSGISIGYIKKNPTTGDFEAVERRVNGPLVLVQTTTKLENSAENESRGYQVYLDDSEGQRTRVHQAVKESFLPHLQIPKGEMEQILRRHQNAQRLLESKPVAIPFVDLIEYPTTQTRSTRDLKRFLNTIAASSFLHQYQRQCVAISGEQVIVATVQDYRIAYENLEKILTDTLADLNPSSLEVLRTAREIVKETQPLFTRKDIARRLGWGRQRVADAISPLEESGYLEFDKTKKPFKYKLLDDEGMREVKVGGILTPEQLEEKIAQNWDKIDSAYLPRKERENSQTMAGVT